MNKPLREEIKFSLLIGIPPWEEEILNKVAKQLENLFQKHLEREVLRIIGEDREIEYGTDIINDTENALQQHQNMGYNLAKKEIKSRLTKQPIKEEK